MAEARAKMSETLVVGERSPSRRVMCWRALEMRRWAEGEEAERVRAIRWKRNSGDGDRDEEASRAEMRAPPCLPVAPVMRMAFLEADIMRVDTIVFSSKESTMCSCDMKVKKIADKESDTYLLYPHGTYEVYTFLGRLSSSGASGRNNISLPSAVSLSRCMGLVAIGNTARQAGGQIELLSNLGATQAEFSH